LAVASLNPVAVVYREEQNFEWWVYLLVALTEAFAGATLAWVYQSGANPVGQGGLTGLVLSLASLGGIALPIMIVVGLLRMTTEVTPSVVRIWFGWIPTYRRFVVIGTIKKIEVVSFRPIVDHGGWGIRSGRDGERVLDARGNRGVRLELSDGSKLLIGSQKPEVLALAIEGALRPGG
jgi:hypothetical protein